MLSFQKLHVYQRSIEFLAFTMDVIKALPKGHARGSAMEAAAALDTMRVMGLVEEKRYGKGLELLEAIVAMLTKMT